MELRTIGIVSKPKKDSVCAVVPDLLGWCKKKQIEALIDEETAGCLISTDGVPRKDIPGKVDLLIVLGGDGTLLAAGRLIRDFSIPILAVNLGSLGFLTDVTTDELYGLLEDILADRHTVEPRYLLEACVHRNSQEVTRYTGVNDIVLHKTSLARIVDFELSLDGSFVSRLRADGLIISSPTGSTAYSLSAGGPVVLPTADAMIITPIAPHMLNSRPLVIPSSSEIEVKFTYREEPIYLTADGQVGEELRPGDTVTVIKSNQSMNLIQSPHRDFFEILRSKLRWGER
jgi:NAD+ kinase